MPNRVAAPMEISSFEPKNRLLAALPERDWSNLQPHLEPVSLVGGSILYDLDEPLTRLYFVETGVVSLQSAFDDRAIGVATVGREGVIDVHSLLLGGNNALGRCQVLVPSSALAVEVEPFRSELRKSPELRAACEDYTRALLVQMLQAVPCNRLHSVEQRCARWLLMCADRAEDDTFELAKESLAQMLGVAQSTSAVVARKLQNERLISYCDNTITVVDRPRLETAACECYRIVRNRYERLPRLGVS